MGLEVPSLLGVLVGHGVLEVLGIPSIQGFQMGPLSRHPPEARQDLATLENPAFRLCQEAHLSPSHPEDLQVPAHQGLPERAEPPSVMRPLARFLPYPEGGDAIRRPGL